MTDSLDQSLQDGLRRQDAASRELLAGGARRLGWKAGFGTAAAIQMLGTEGPLAGFLTHSTLAPSGASFEVGDWGKPILEPEVAVRLAADLDPGRSRAEVEAAVGDVGAAIELVDLGGAGSDAGEILAANIFHRAVLLGDLSPLDAGTSLADVRIDVLAGGDDYAVAADPAAVLGDLVDVLAAMANLLAYSDDSLRAGDVIITGAAVKPFELSGGEEIEVRVGHSRVSALVQHSLPR
jgi:2-keto-4-pentenoate hydratase